MALKRFQLNLRSMIGVHQGRERVDVLLTVILPLFLMVVSSYTNAWAFTGGHLSVLGENGVNTLVAIVKGLFVEALVFCFFKLVKILVDLGGWRSYLAATIPFLVGLFGVIVSSGCGLAWAVKSGEMTFLITTVSTYIGPTVAGLFQSGIGLLFPVAVAVLAVYDPKQMIQEHMHSGSELKVMAMRVENAEHHQEMLRQAQIQANEDQSIKDAYKRMAATNAQQAVKAAEQGDYSFGLNTEPLHLPAAGQSSVTRVTPVPQTAYPGLPSPVAGGLPSLGPISNQPTTIIPGQVMQNPPFSGNTAQLQVPTPAMTPAAMPAPKKGGLLGWMAGG